MYFGSWMVNQAMAFLFIRKRDMCSFVEILPWWLREEPERSRHGTRSDKQGSMEETQWERDPQEIWPMLQSVFRSDIRKRRERLYERREAGLVESHVISRKVPRPFTGGSLISNTPRLIGQLHSTALWCSVIPEVKQLPSIDDVYTFLSFFIDARHTCCSPLNNPIQLLRTGLNAINLK